MEALHEDLLSYEPDDSLCCGQPVFLMLKGFNQEAIVAKIIERQGQRAFGLTASNDPADRRYGLGLAVGATLDASVLDATTIARSTHTITCLEPFSLAFRGTYIACTNGSEIQILDVQTGARRRLRHPWLAFAHTVEYSPSGTHLLVSSAGFDTLLEFALDSSGVAWEWNAWDHGITKVALDGTHVARSHQQAAELRDSGRSVTLVDDPNDWPPEGMPTHRAPGRLNGASYDGPDRFLLTFYHRPELTVVERRGDATFMDRGLRHPHGFIANAAPGSAYVVTNSGAGELLTLDGSFRVVRRLSFRGMPADPLKARLFGEWIQSVTIVDRDRQIVAAVDALRDGVHLVDLRTRSRRFVANPPEWHLHAVIPIPIDFELSAPFAHWLPGAPR